MFNLKQFFKKLKLEKEEREANPVSGFNAIEKFKQDIIPKIKSIGRGITAVAKSPFQIVEKKPERFTFETEEDFAERTKNIEFFKDKGLPETKASQFIKSAGARLPEELIKGGAKAIQTLGQLGKIGLDKDISEITKVPKQLQRFIGNEEELKSYYVEYAECVDKGENPFICSAKNASKFAVDLSIVMDFALAGIKSGIKALPINKTIEEVGHKASFIQLGRPKTIEQAEINYKNILRDVSPLSSKANRLGTVNVEATKEAKNAFDLLKAKGIPNTSKLGAFLGRLEKPFKIREFFKEAKKLRETGFISPKALIPEQAGTMPTELFKPKTPAFGLSIRDIKAKPIAPKASVQSLAQEARKYKSAEEFVKNKINAYHGTNREFGKFDLSKIGSERDKGFFGKGFYFSDKASVAGFHGGKVMELNVDLKNPLKLNVYDGLDFMERVKREGAAEVTNALKKQGYDGIMIDRKWYDWKKNIPDDYTEIVA